MDYLEILKSFAPDILVGAWTGYITNLIALKMIFTEYGVSKFKFGGVIVRTRDLFIDNLSTLIEDELISRDAVKSSLESEAFLDATRLFLADASAMFAERFSVVTSTSEIKNIAQEISKINKYVDNYLPVLCSDDGLVSAALSRIIDKVAGYIGGELRSDVRKLFCNIIDSETVKIAFTSFVHDIKDVTVKNALGEEFAMRLSGNVTEIYKNAVMVIQSDMFGGTLRTLMAISRLVIDLNALNRLEKSAANLTVTDLLGRERSNNIKKFVADISESRCDAISDLIRDALPGLMGAAIPKTRRDAHFGALTDVLLVDNEKLKSFLSSAYKLVTRAVDSFVDNNGDQINSMLQMSIDGAITSGQGNKGIVAFARRAFFRDVVSRIDFIGEFKDYIDSSIDDLQKKYDSKFIINLIGRYRLSDALSKMGIDMDMGIDTDNGIDMGNDMGDGIVMGDGIDMGNDMGNGIDMSYDMGNGIDMSNDMGIDMRIDIPVKKLLTGAIDRLLEIVPANAVKAMKDDARERVLEQTRRFVVSKFMSGLSVGGNVYGYIEEALIHKINDVMATGAGTYIEAARQNLKPSTRELADTGVNIISAALRDGTPGKDTFRIRFTKAILTFINSRKNSVKKLIADIISDAKPSKIIESLMNMLTVSMSGIATSISRFLSINYDVMIKGKIKNAVSGKLKKMKDADILKLAENFFGQLKHIIILGAIIGGVIGIAAGFANSAWSGIVDAGKNMAEAGAVAADAVVGAGVVGAADAAVAGDASVSVMSVVGAVGGGYAVAMVAINVILMGLIGWLTNVVALEMIFRPRKTVNILGYKLRSVISVNKEKLATSVGRFVDATLLDGDVSAQMIESNKKALEDVLQSNIDKQQYNVLGAAITRNSVIIGEKISESVLDYAVEHSGVLLRRSRNVIRRESEKGFIQGVRQEGRQGVRQEGRQDGCQEAPQEGLHEASQEGLQGEPQEGRQGESQEGLHEERQESCKEELHEALQYVRQEARQESRKKSSGTDTVIESVIDSIIGAIAVSDISISGLLNGLNYKKTLENAFLNFDDIELRSLIRKIIGSFFEQWIALRADKPLVNDADSMNALIDAFLPKGDKRGATLKNVLAGVIYSKESGTEQFVISIAEKYIKTNLYRLIDYLNNKLTYYLRENKSRFGTMAKQIIRAKLGMLQTLAYNAAEGDELVDRVISDLVDARIPQFVESNYVEINKAFDKTINEILNLLKKYNPIRIKPDQIDLLLDSLCQDEGFMNAAASIMSEIGFSVFEGVTKSDILRLADIETTGKLLTVADPLIRNIALALTESIRIENDDLSAAFASFFDELILKTGDTLNAANVMRGYTAKDMSVLKKCAADAIRSCDLAEPAEAAVNEGVFDGVVATLIEKLCRDSDVRKDSAELFAGIVNDLGLNIEEAADKNLLGEITKGIIDSVILALKGDLPDMLKTINFKDVAEKQINSMDSAQIEKMFMTVTGKYIKRLKLYGLWGGAFGLHHSLPLVSFVGAAAIKLRSALKNRYGRRHHNRRQHER